MKQWVEKIIEKIVVNISWNILKAMCVTLIPFGMVWLNSYLGTGKNPYVLSVIPFFIFLLAFFTFRHFLGPQYPDNICWDVIHRNNSYILSFHTREKAEYTKSIELTVLRDDIKSFPVGDYVWTGDGSSPKIDPKDKFVLKTLDESCGSKHKYVVEPKYTIRAYSKLNYTIFVNLEDKSRKMVPRNAIYIKRPTRSITLELTIPKEIPIKNVRFKATTKLGEEHVFIDKEGILTSTGGHTIGSKTYKFTIVRPKMLCEYEICWEWDNDSDTGV